MRSTGDICDEMQVLSRLGYKFANLYDNINIDEEFALKLCHKIEENRIELNWGCELRADKLSKELAQALRQAGCLVVAVGIESGDPEVLKLANKPQKLEQVKNGIKTAKSVGLSVQAYFVIGLPGETKESFLKTQNLNLKKDVLLIFLRYVYVLSCFARLMRC